jgi:hypothetical protein
MLPQLDVLIGFVVVMSLVSLLISITVQMVSAILGLRGGNLRDALVTTLHKFCPGTPIEVQKALAHRLLSDPSASDSILHLRTGVLGTCKWEWPRRLQLASAIRTDELLELLKDVAGRSAVSSKIEIAKVLAQPCQTVLDVLLLEKANGSSFPDKSAVAQVHYAAKAALAAVAESDKAHVANELVTATVTTDELHLVLNAAGKAASEAEEVLNVLTSWFPDSKAEASKLLGVLTSAKTAEAGLRATLSAGAGASLTAAATAVGDLVRCARCATIVAVEAVWRIAQTPGYTHGLKRLSTGQADAYTTLAAEVALCALMVPPESFNEARKAVSDGLTDLAKKKGAAIIVEFDRASNVALQNLERWLNSAQDRAQQWFAMHTRIGAVILAFLAAFGLQLDSIEMIKRLSVNPELRSKLVNLASSELFTSTNQAQLIVTTSGGIWVDRAMHQDAFTEMGTNVERYAAITNADIQESLRIKRRDFEAMKLSAAMAFVAGTNGVTNNSSLEILPLIARDYSEIMLQRRLRDLSDSFLHVVKASEQAGLQLLPDPYPEFLSYDFWFPPRHLVGMLLSAGLLSIGAPFWFNLLKSLASLRPKLAERVDQQSAQLPAALTGDEK